MKVVYYRLILLVLGSSSLVLSGCGGGGGSVSGGIGASTGGITVTQVYPTASGSTWTPIVLASRYYVAGLNLSVKGTCERGITSISVDDGFTTYATQATCTGLGSFTWNNTFLVGDQGDKTLTLTALDVNAAPVAGAVTTVDVRVDNIAPSAPVVTFPVTSPYTHNGASGVVTISGTVDPDVVTLTGPASASITPVAGAWSHNVTITPGSTLNFDYYAYDLAGNQSPVTTQTITYTPSVQLLYAVVLGGSSITDGGTNYTLEGTAEVVSARSVDVGTSYILETGFNFVTNTVRGP